MEGDPYRTAGNPNTPCPRCKLGLEGDPLGQMACMAGCGEWFAKEELTALLTWRDVRDSEPDVLTLIGQPFPPAPCPICHREMVVATRARVVFDYCDAHGVWLDRREKELFDAAFGIWRKLFSPKE